MTNYLAERDDHSDSLVVSCKVDGRYIQQNNPSHYDIFFLRFEPFLGWKSKHFVEQRRPS